MCLCSCSEKDIAARNFTVHEVHCVRNITLCPHCNDPVAKTDLDNHIAEQHTSVTCPQCHASLMKSEVDQHIADAHATEPCPECGENVSKNLLEDHKRSAHSTTACPLCHKVVDKTHLHQHQVSIYCCIFCLLLVLYDVEFLSASLYFCKRGAYSDRLCRDVVGRWLSRACTVAKRCILGL